MPRPMMIFGHLLWFDHKALYASLVSVAAALIGAVVEDPSAKTGLEVVGVGGLVVAICSYGITIAKLWIEQRDKERVAAAQSDKEKWERHGILNKLNDTMLQLKVLKAEKQHAAEEIQRGERERIELRADLARHQGWIEKMIERYPDMPPPPPSVSPQTQEMSGSGVIPTFKPPQGEVS